MRRAARTDGNHSQIVDELRRFGATVQSLAGLGKGVPDILVGWHDLNFVFEIKDPEQPKSDRQLTPKEQEWHMAWNGQVHTIENSERALTIMQRTDNANRK